jgi:hypothetical protein
MTRSKLTRKQVSLFIHNLHADTIRLSRENGKYSVLPRLGQLLLGCATLLSKQGDFLLFDAGKLKDLLQQASQVSTTARARYTPHLLNQLNQL